MSLPMDASVMNLSSMALRSLVWACACSEWNKRAIRRIHHSLILGSTTAICSPSLPTSFSPSRNVSLFSSFLAVCPSSSVRVPHSEIVMSSSHYDLYYASYRVTHLLANLGWVDFDLGCSTILPSCSAASAKFPPAQAELGRQWNSQNASQPNPGSPGDGSPCTTITARTDGGRGRRGGRDGSVSGQVCLCSVSSVQVAAAAAAALCSLRRKLRLIHRRKLRLIYRSGSEQATCASGNQFAR